MKIPRGIPYNRIILEYLPMSLFAIEFYITWFIKNQYNQKEYNLKEKNPDYIFVFKQKYNKDLITKLSNGNIK